MRHSFLDANNTLFSFTHLLHYAFTRFALCPKARINTPLSLPLLAFVQQSTLIARSCASTLDRPACLGDASLVNRTPSLSTARSPFCIGVHGVHIRRAVCTYLVHECVCSPSERRASGTHTHTLLPCSIKREEEKEEGGGNWRRAVALYAADL